MDNVAITTTEVKPTVRVEAATYPQNAPDENAISAARAVVVVKTEHKRKDSTQPTVVMVETLDPSKVTIINNS